MKNDYKLKFSFFLFLKKGIIETHLNSQKIQLDYIKARMKSSMF